jgi:hypothetical protein
MSTRFIAAVCAALSLLQPGRAGDPKTPATLLTERGKLLVSDDFDRPLGKDWKPNRGRWMINEGVLQGTELKEDEHAAVLRRAAKGHDLIYQFSFKLGEATRIGVNCDEPMQHTCLVAMTPGGLMLIRAQSNRDKNDKRVVLGSDQTPIDPKAWHTLVFEVRGNTALASLDGKTVVFGAHDKIDVDKASFAISVAGGPASLKDLRVWEALPNKNWEATRTRLSASKASRGR